MGAPHQDPHPNDGSGGLDGLSSLLPTLMMMRSSGVAGGGPGDTPWLQLLLAVLLPILLRLVLPKLQNALNQVSLYGRHEPATPVDYERHVIHSPTPTNATATNATPTHHPHAPTNAVTQVRPSGRYATRTIVYTRETGVWRWWDDKEDDDSFNAIVQKAILTYINKVRD